MMRDRKLKQLRLQKQTLRDLLDKDLALARGGLHTTDTRGPSEMTCDELCGTSLCDTSPCIEPSTP